MIERRDKMISDYLHLREDQREKKKRTGSCTMHTDVSDPAVWQERVCLIRCDDHRRKPLFTPCSRSNTSCVLERGGRSATGVPQTTGANGRGYMSKNMRCNTRWCIFNCFQHIEKGILYFSNHFERMDLDSYCHFCT